MTYNTPVIHYHNDWKCVTLHTNLSIYSTLNMLPYSPWYIILLCWRICQFIWGVLTEITDISVNITICGALFLSSVHYTQCVHDDIIKWKHFPRNWPFVLGIHRSPVSSPHKGQWRGALMFSLICVWINDWVNTREAGDLRRYRPHYDVIVMYTICCTLEILHLWSSPPFKLKSLFSYTQQQNTLDLIIRLSWLFLMSTPLNF